MRLWGEEERLSTAARHEPVPSSSAAASAVLDACAARSAAQIGAENFPVALRLLPSRPRDQLARLYAYARFVDDVGDEAPGDRLALLDLIADDLNRLPEDAARLPPVRGLQPLLAEPQVTLQPFLDLIAANRLDQRVSEYPDFADLLGYCQLSAAPVGRVVLALAGAANPGNEADSDAVCAGLQVLEHCQDVGEDAAAGRVYLPGTELAAAGVRSAQLTGTTTPPELRAVLRTQVERSLELLGAGGPLVSRLRGWARVAVAGYVAGGLATAAELRRCDFEVLASPVTPSKARTGRIAVALLLGRRPR
jgi:squalene synthase HpnC